jgi:hypothetical protein
MKSKIAIILTTSMLVGCSITNHVTSPGDNVLERKDGTVHLTNGRNIVANNIHVLVDSLSFTEGETNLVTTISLRDISKVKRTSHSMGAVHGVAIGSFVGLGTIGVANIITERRRRNTEEEYYYNNGAGLVFAGGAILGGVLGAIGGAIIGSHETYVFYPDSASVHTAEVDSPN